MGLRYRKTFKAGPLRITTSKSGISTSIGGKGARITKTASGKTRTTLSIPGSGVSYVSETGGKQSKERRKEKHSKNTRFSSEYLAALELAQKELERKERKKKMRMPQKPPKSVKAVRISGISLIVIGACAFVIPPLGILILTLGIYMTVKAPQIYKKSVEKYESAMAEREAFWVESVDLEGGSNSEQL